MGKAASKPIRWRRLKRKKREDASAEAASPDPETPGESAIVYINDRKYHNPHVVPSLTPADEDEGDRTSARHFLNKAEWGGTNFSSPVHGILNRGANVLDIGCGNAVWLLDMASEYTSSRFVGVAMDEIHPVTIKPRNLDFVQCNLFVGLPFEDGEFDFVFMRYMTSSIPESKWPYVLTEMARVTKSGGYMEIEEIEFTYVGEGPNTLRFETLAIETIYRLYNINMQMNCKIPGWLEETEMVRSVTQRWVNTAVGGNTKAGQARLDIALWGAYNIKRTVRAFGMTDEEYDDLVKAVYKELKEKEVMEPLYRTFAQKA